MWGILLICLIIPKGYLEDNMFEISNLYIPSKQPQIEGGGKYPQVKYTGNDIAVVNVQDIKDAMVAFRDDDIPDLNGRTEAAWFDGTTDQIDDLLTIFGVESASNIDRYGEAKDIANVPYNANAEYNVPGRGESYGVIQIDIGANYPYVLMAMDENYMKELQLLGQESVEARNKRAKEILEEPGVKDKAIAFLKDTDNIMKHLLIASTVYNDNGLNGWKAYSNYNDPNGDTGFKELYDMVQEQNDKRTWKSWNKKLMQENEKNTADMLYILELADKMPVNIEDRANALISAYTEFKKITPDMTEFADKKIDKLKPFAGIYGK